MGPSRAYRGVAESSQVCNGFGNPYDLIVSCISPARQDNSRARRRGVGELRALVPASKYLRSMFPGSTAAAAGVGEGTGVPHLHLWTVWQV